MRTKLKNTLNPSAGFTIIEAVATIVVGGMFLFSLVMLFSAVNKSSVVTRNQAIANDLSYAYLRKYAYAGATPTWFTTCDSTTDLTANSNATGLVLTSGSLSSSESGLPSPVSYSVKAFAIYGCSGVNLKSPIRVDASVTYSPNNLSVSHSTIVGY